MKNISLLLYLFFSLYSTGQTKQETINWLNNKFGNPQASIYSSDDVSFARFLKIKNDGSFIITQHETWQNNNGTESHYIKTFSGNFKNLSSSSFNIKKIEKKGIQSSSSTSNTYLYLTCKPGSFIKQINYSEGTKIEESQIVTISNKMSDVCIGIIPENSDQSLIERSKKAFLHLIKLCGGKKEAF